MIISVASLALVLAAAEPTPEEARPVDDSLSAHRSPFEALSERLIGTASRAVRFDWRQKTVGLGLVTSGLLELNDFSSVRIGGVARIPAGTFMVELGVTRALTWGSASTDILAQTPYRQAARPGRFEIDVNVELPLAEGVVTPRFAFVPPAEMVFSVTAGFRYLVYTETWRDLSAGDVTLALFSPRLSAKEIANLDAARLPGMQVDPARMWIPLGFAMDIYFQPGLFISPRVMFIPNFGNVPGSLGSWWELSMRLGWFL